MLDDVVITRKKIMSAVTDSINIVKYDEKNQPGISNLITIMAVLSKKDIKEIEKDFCDSNYGDFKKAVADVVEKFLIDFQKRYSEIRNSEQLLNILKNGAKVAQLKAECKLNEVKNKMGIDI